jgi:type VI secretion system protein ImpJ
MSWSNKIVWSEGLFLSPQLFQQQERYLEDFAHKRTQVLSPFYWGFSKYIIDQESLLLGKLVLAQATGIFTDGTPFDVPTHTPSAPPLTILPEHLNQVIYLGLPIRTPNGEETSFENAAGSLARFSVTDAEIRDANSIGQGAKLVQIGHLRLRLIPEKELSSAWMGMPLARITAIKSDGSVEIDPQFIPPVNQCDASDLLSQWLTQLHGNMEQRAIMLAQRLSGPSTGAQAADVTDFLLLQMLNRYEAHLNHILQVDETSPETAYILLKNVSAEFSTFIRHNTRRPVALPHYLHADPYHTFKDLVEDVRELLNNVLVRSAQSITLISKPHGVYLASLDPNELKGYNAVVLAVSAAIPSEQLATSFPTQCKIAPPDRLSEHVRLHLPGMSISSMPVPPRQLPYNAGFVYFQIDPRGPLWEQSLKTGGIALHLAGDLPQLRMELWGIR